MSFVPLDRVDFSREDSLQATPVRIRAIGRCKSPVPASEHSFDATPRERQPFSQAPSNASRIQPTPSHQPSIPRHRRAGDDLLRTLNESVTDLRDELHNKSQSGETLATERIADLCRKLDVIASVVLRHERELKSQSTLVDHLSAAKPSHNRDETSELMTSILMKVNEVNSMVSGAPRPKSVARMHETSQTSMSADLATPLYRIAEALDSVTKEVQRQHVTIERLAKAQLEREEDERIATAMAIRPPSVISASTEDPHRAFTHRMRLAAEELPAREIQTPSYHSNSRTSAIAPNEESPRRMRHYEAPSGEIEASADELTLPEGDLDPSPARMRFAPRFESEEASPPRQRQARQLPVEGSTVAAKTVFDVSIQRTVSKQPEYLVRGASAQRLSSRKPVCRPDIFDTSSNSSAATPVRLNETQSDHDTLIQQLMRENESLKDQLYHQLQKYDDLRSVVHESSPRGRGRSFVSATVF